MLLSDWDERRPLPGSTNYMFGIQSLIDGPCAMDYDPWVHAEDLAIPVIVNPNLPSPKMIAAFSRRRGAIFLRPNQRDDVERCALAHEIVHFEHQDVGTTRSQEDRADRIAAQRLIRPTRLREVALQTDDPGRIAYELGVTEHMMRIYMRNHA
ncbi:ImmA/IrrE family metallo-endopeptidase [Leifsonia sp. ZF2019]|uniref:ImmA/IrrE family metallo-endopeptidase n=1 Tax=Leifsonia sp. ZF2019 TaxID=2781978 RepID=UPI001CBFAD50|nr:ImmA/IrrE family metallo-endopeptidase [Leifsonia sp. ZF2019]UAJ80196.1 ImmA/IrrE family metallo-endopeptidase [Leifsonia sp. ZF2019]